jgi:phenylalanyl-tRNA synthetase beta chain
MELEPILRAASRANKLTPIFKNYPTVPASERDLAFVVKETTQVNSVLNAIGKAAGPLMENVQLLDRYKGAPVEIGYCSLNVRLRFRSEDKTLRDEQVEPLMKTVREMLLEKFNAQLRV